MIYQERLIARKRIFGTLCPTLSEAGKGESTTLPLPLMDGYIRGYWPVTTGYNDYTLMPHEKRNKDLHKFTRRFEY